MYEIAMLTKNPVTQYKSMNGFSINHRPMPLYVLRNGMPRYSALQTLQRLNPWTAIHWLRHERWTNAWDPLQSHGCRRSPSFSMCCKQMRHSGTLLEWTLAVLNGAPSRPIEPDRNKNYKFGQRCRLQLNSYNVITLAALETTIFFFFFLVSTQFRHEQSILNDHTSHMKTFILSGIIKLFAINQINPDWKASFEQCSIRIGILFSLVFVRFAGNAKQRKLCF